MRFLADMNLSPLTVQALAAEGVDIVRVSSLLPVNAPDEKVLVLAREQGQSLHKLSFAGTIARVNALAPYLWFHARTHQARIVYTLLLEWIRRDKLPNRPHRIEPRAVKRRPKRYTRLNRPRHELQQTLLRATG